MRACIVAIQTEHLTPSPPPPTPCHCKSLIINGYFRSFWVLGINLPYTYTPTQCADGVVVCGFSAFDFVACLWFCLILTICCWFTDECINIPVARMGVVGVEGVGQVVCMTTIRARMRAKFSTMSAEIWFRHHFLAFADIRLGAYLTITFLVFPSGIFMMLRPRFGSARRRPSGA